MTLAQARDEYVCTFCADVATFPNAYKKRVVDDPDGHALRTIEGLDVSEIRRMTRELKAEMKACGA